MSTYVASKEKLEPCPFCGSKNLSIRVDDNNYKIPYFVNCDDCNTEGPQVYGNEEKFDPIKAWNTRIKQK